MTKVDDGKHLDTFFHKIDDREKITEELLSGNTIWLENLEGFRYISKHNRMVLLKNYLVFNKLINGHDIRNMYIVSITFGFGGIMYNKGTLLEYLSPKGSQRISGLYLAREK